MYSNMDFDLFSCTFENLNSLKFNELQKLSSQYRVNKRWAKKREIIDKLLLLRDQEIEKRNLICDNAEKNVRSQENMQWIDGNKVFSSDTIEKVLNDDKIDRRLTYNVGNSNEDTIDRRLTFNVVKNEGNQKRTVDTNLVTCDNLDRRLTYNADEMKGLQKSISNNVNATVQVSVPVEDTKHDASGIMTHKEKDLFEPNKQILSVNEKSNINNESKIDGRVLGGDCDQTQKSKVLNSAKPKMLTIPYSRIPAQSRKSAVKEVKGCDNTKVKPCEKIPPASRLIKSRLDISKTPHTLKKQNLQLSNKVTALTKSMINKSLSTSKPNGDNPSLKSELSKLDTTRRIVPRRKSKTEDNVLVTNLKSIRNLKFLSPNESHIKNQKRLSEQNLDMNLRSKIPKARPMVETQKLLTAKKMPDFSKIHQKQFEQMDSLLDYKRKKEERAKRLFGMPQPGIPTKMNTGNVSGTLFQFKSSHNEKENQLNKTTGTMRKPLQTDVKQLKEKPTRQDMMNRAGSKLNIVSNMKEQNRKHLNGVRTNKRFELQMKCRKI